MPSSLTVRSIRDGEIVSTMAKYCWIRMPVGFFYHAEFSRDAAVGRVQMTARLPWYSARQNFRSSRMRNRC